MARRPLVVGSLASLSLPLAAFLLVQLIGTVTGHGVASTARGGDFEIPDYVKKYGISRAQNFYIEAYITDELTAPLVWLHSQDPFRPADLLQHVHHTTPMTGQEAVSNLTDLNLDNLAILNDVRSQPVALTSKDDVTTLPNWLLGQTPDESGKITNATACVVILIEKGALDVDAFYFYFYSYDRGPNITQVLEPLNRLFGDDVPGYSFGDHIGDWEHNMVRFHDGKPTGIYYSQHRDGAAYDWDNDAISKTNERPLVFSAYGSHANYPSEGEHVHDIVLVDYCDSGKVWDPVLSAYFYHLEPSTFHLTRLFEPNLNESKTVNQTSFFYFTGIWGDAQYPDDHPLQKTVPHFGLKRFVSGPTGPAAKQLLRKGLAPDHARQRTWIEWAVGVFMAWYPCCIRGPRKWAAASIVVGSLILLALGIRYARRRRKLKEYTRVETEIPMEELRRIEDAR